MLDTKDWKEFQLKDIFKIENCKGIDALRLDLKEKADEKYSFDFIGRTNEGYGVQGYVKEQDFAWNNKNTITISQVGTVIAQYRMFDYYTSQNVFKLTTYEGNLNPRQYLFLVNAINKILIKYTGYTNFPTIKKLNNDIIFLPQKNGDPDWEYLEEYIKYIENKHIENLKAKNDKDIKTALEIVELNESDLEEDLTVEPPNRIEKFKLKDVLIVNSSKRIFHANQIGIQEKPMENLYPYVVRSEYNNGIRGFISEDSKFLNDSGTISFAQDTFVSFYQKRPYFTGNKVKVLTPSYNKSEGVLLYLQTVINKILNKNSWGTGSDVEYIENLELELPAIDEFTPDFDYMEKAIYIY